MAAESYKDFLTKYGGPTSTNIIRDKEGAMIGSTKAGSNVEKYIQAGKPVYKTDTPGEFTTEAPASISLDKQTGKITVEAPKSILESPDFVEELEILKTYSAAYKANPKATMHLTDAKGNETGEELTVPEYIERLNTPQEIPGTNKKISPIQQTVATQQYRNNINIDFGNNVKIMDAEGNLKPAQLTKEQITGLTSFGAGDGVDKDTFIAIPKGIKEFEKAGIYKNVNWKEIEGVGYLPIGTFKELWYNRNSTTRNEIISTFSEMEQYLLKFQNQPMMEESADLDKYVSTYALYNYMIKNDPDCDLWHGIGDSVMVVVNASADVILGGTTLIGVGGGLLVDAVYNLGSAIYERVNNFSEEQKESLKRDKSTAQLAYEQLTAAHDTIKRLSDADWSGGLDTAVYSAYQLKDSDFTFNDAADAAEAIVEGVENLAIMISAGNAMANIVKSGLATAAGASSAGATAIRGVEVGAQLGLHSTAAITSGTTTLVSLLGSKGAANLLGVVSGFLSNGVVNFGLSTLAESIGEALFQNPQEMARILADGEMTNEANALLWENYAINTLYDIDDQQKILDYVNGKVSKADLNGIWNETYWGNVIGGVIGVQTSKALLNLGYTTFGRTASTVLRNKIYKIQGAVGDTLDSIRLKLKGYADISDWAANIKNPTKREAFEIRRKLREKKQQIASDTIKIVGKNKDEILEQLDKAQDKLDELMSLENALDDLKRGGTLQISEWENSADNPLFANANRKIQKLTGELMEAEHAAGFQSAAKVNAGALFSKETTEYIGASVRVPILEAATKVISDSKAIQEELSFWKGRISSYKTLASPEMIALADEYVNSYKNWWNQAINLWKREGLISEVDIERWRKAGIWGKHGELYARLQRKQEMSDYVVLRRDGRLDQKTIENLGHYNWGSTDEFVDPTLVMQDELRRQANAKLRQQVVKSFYGENGPTIVTTAEQMQLATTVAPKIGNFNSEVKTACDSIVESLGTRGTFEAAVDFKTAQKMQQTEKGVANRLAKAVRPKTPITLADTQALVMVMPDSEIDALFGLHFDNNSLEDVIDVVNDKTIKKQLMVIYGSALNNMEESGTITNNYLTIENIRLANSYDPQLKFDAERAILSADSTLVKEPYIVDTINASKDNRFLLDARTLYNESIEKAAKYSEDAGLARNSLLNMGRQSLNDIAEMILDEKNLTGQMLTDIANQYGGKAPDVVKQYLVYEALYKNRNDIKKNVSEAAHSYFKNLKINNKSLTPTQYEKYSNEVGDLVKQQIEGYKNYYRGLAGQITEATPLIDKNNWQEEIYKVANEITKVKKGKNIIPIQNSNGSIELVKVDPLLADLVTTKPAGKDMGMFGKINYLWMKLFRMGTTGINPSSMVNQEFRDLGNAWIMGNVNSTITENQRKIAEIFGENPAEFLASYSQEAQENFRKIATEQNRPIGEVIAEAEGARAQRVAQASTESEALRLYKQTREMWYAGGIARDSQYDKLINTIDSFTEKAGFINEKREKYLRNLVYANNYSLAIKNGRSIQSARIFAEFMANNATTNFTRSVGFLTSIQDTVPYLRAAINGSKSFWRLLSIDPVGVSGRILGGLIIPTIALTTMSLSSEENRKAYKNIKEYKKEDSLPIVLNGEVFMLPLPQEMSMLVTPVRQAIEATFNVGTGAGLELVVNDLLAFSPVDLGGFTDLDNWRLYGTGVDWGERLTRGSAQLFSGIAPKYAVAMATAVSGRDLYTGQKIDTSYTTVNPDTGEIEVISYTAGTLANKIHEIFPNLSAPVAQDMLENIFGTAGNGILDFLVRASNAVYTGTTTGSWAEAGKELLDTTAEGLAYSIRKPVYPSTSNAVQKEWKDQIGALWEEKKAILAGDAWQAYVKMANKAMTPQEIEAAAVARANIIDPFYDKVKNVVIGLINGSGMDYTPEKFASVLSLMNLQLSTSTGNAAIKQANNDLYKESKRAAITTMTRLGFPSTSISSSALGEVVTSSTGDTYIRYATPIELLDMQQTYYAQNSIHRSEIEILLDSNGIDRGKMFEGYNQAKTKSQKKQAKAQWNARVINALAPYIQKYGSSAVINNQETVDLLSRYIFVDNPYTAKQYLQTIFK